MKVNEEIDYIDIFSIKINTNTCTIIYIQPTKITFIETTYANTDV